MDYNPPQSNEAEQAILGCILVDQDSIYKTINILEPNDFYNTKNKIVYSAMVEMFKTGQKIDLLTLVEYLSSQKTLSKAGGRVGVAQYTNIPSSVAQIGKYCEIVRDKSIRRQLLTAQEQNLKEIYNEDQEINTVLAETQNRIVGVNNFQEIKDDAKTIIRELEQAQDEYAEKYENGQNIIGYSSGLEKIDEMIDGLRPGHVWVIGAFTSTGKTQFSLNIANAVLGQNVPTSIISLEMSRIDTIARMIGIRENISSMKVIKGKMDESLFKKIEASKNFLINSPLEIHTTYFDIEKIKMLIRKDVYTRGVKFVIVDYVQNIMSEKGTREYELLTQSAVDLQNLARELGITVLIVSQISNEAEKGGGAGAGFKGTGALEAVADLAIRLKRDKKKEDPDDESVPVKIIVAKNRHGFSGTISNYSMQIKSGKFEKDVMYLTEEQKKDIYKRKK